MYGVANLADTSCWPTFTVLDVHRNMYGKEEYVRARGALWHWDTGPPTRVKMLLYLSPVDREHACFVALRHNATGLPLVMDGSKPWGEQNAPAQVPKEWLLQAIEQGYRPTCMAGPPGTLNVFDPNIMHRASRPQPGKYRDAITFFFHPPTCQQKPPAA